MATANKGYATPVTGTESGTWGDTLNNQVFSYVDQNMGGLTTLSLSSSNVILSASQSRDCILRLTGTLLASVQITTSCVGFFFVENVTSGAFTVTVTNGVAGAVAPQGSRVTMISDASNGVRVAGSDGFGVGTKMLFFNTTAPAGWTKDTSLDNGTIRLVSGTVDADGGSANFTDVFTSRTPTGTIGGTAITYAQMPPHRHYIAATVITGSSGSPTLSSGNQLAYGNHVGSGDQASYDLKGTSTGATVGRTSEEGDGDTHTHTFTGSAMNFAVKYANAIRATRA